MNVRNMVFVVVAVVSLVLDQLTKAWVEQNLRPYRDSIPVIDGFFELVHVRNSGAAGGLLGDFEYRMWVFLGFAVVALYVMVSMVREFAPTERLQPALVGLIVGGALGNAVDRVREQSVTDFLRFYTDDPEWKPWLIDRIGTAEYPSFNVADIAIVVGVLGMMVMYWIYGENKPKAPPAETASGPSAPGASASGPEAPSLAAPTPEP